VNCKKNDKFNNLYKRILENTNQNKLDLFKSTEIDSSGEVIKLLYKEVEREYVKLDETSKLLYFLNSKLGTLDSIKVSFLVIGFHDYYNGKVYDFDFIKSRVNEIRYFESLREYKKEYKKVLEISKKNNSKNNIGDTINFCLPKRKIIESEMEETFYYSELPHDFNCKTYSTLEVCGVILDKSYLTNYVTADTLELVFHLKLLTLEDSMVKINNKINTIGDTVKLYVTGYSRLIDDCCCSNLGNVPNDTFDKK